ncbi:hypothetical protein K7X08_011760 [Anisodus acutangulus]|uniref:Uncharacterized protein n=1 Tax=Anisodus acutangulus TaxID=402998 RepID=A0A9Q1MP35_9SOLA|nr:hypothetical protein K7X08_011760 [Anisodus acutangulus]
MALPTANDKGKNVAGKELAIVPKDNSVQSNNKFDTLNDGDVVLEDVVEVADASKPQVNGHTVEMGGTKKWVDKAFTMNQACQEMPSTNDANGNARKFWSEHMEEDGEEGEIPCDKGTSADQELSVDSVTSLQEILDMFDEATDETWDDLLEISTKAYDIGTKVMDHEVERATCHEEVDKEPADISIHDVDTQMKDHGTTEYADGGRSIRMMQINI